jgi:predicted ribosome quality control (RQC) complex YloA/Tae2 family protein
VDAAALDGTLAELRPVVVGRHLSRPRLAAGDALVLEIGGSRELRLWLDAGRGTAGAYLLPRETARSLAELHASPVPGRARQALLHVRKHLDGARVLSLSRVPGERVILVETGGGTLVLRFSGAAPALSLVRGGEVLGTLGEGAAAWPVPDPAPEREWDRMSPEAFAATVETARAQGRSLARAALSACPGLGPLAREVDGSAASLVALRARLADGRPRLPAGGAAEARPSTWLEAGRLFLDERRRALELERRRRAALDEVRRQVRRLEQLAANLERDIEGLADADALRRRAEALLARGHGRETGRESMDVPDPREPARTLRIALDPRLCAVANAERMFDRARRAERARRQVELRLRETRSALVEARRREAEVLEAATLGRLAPHARAQETAGDRGSSPRHYLTSRGLSILVGRNARENHHLTFRLAGPEDLWLHARDAPGAHVVLRDNEGRAGADDLREAAETAAFFSEARAEAQVDVHVTRRKHVRPARGGPGRVFVAHSDTLRAAPRDPEGRLRRR